MATEMATEEDAAPAPNEGPRPELDPFLDEFKYLTDALFTIVYSLALIETLATHAVHRHNADAQATRIPFTAAGTALMLMMGQSGLHYSNFKDFFTPGCNPSEHAVFMSERLSLLQHYVTTSPAIAEIVKDRGIPYLQLPIYLKQKLATVALEFRETADAFIRLLIRLGVVTQTVPHPDANRVAETGGKHKFIPYDGDIIIVRNDYEPPTTVLAAIHTFEDACDKNHAATMKRRGMRDAVAMAWRRHQQLQRLFRYGEVDNWHQAPALRYHAGWSIERPHHHEIERFGAVHRVSVSPSLEDSTGILAKAEEVGARFPPVEVMRATPTAETALMIASVRSKAQERHDYRSRKRRAVRAEKAMARSKEQAEALMALAPTWTASTGTASTGTVPTGAAPTGKVPRWKAPTGPASTGPAPTGTLSSGTGSAGPELALRPAQPAQSSWISSLVSWVPALPSLPQLPGSTQAKQATQAPPST